MAGAFNNDFSNDFDIGSFVADIIEVEDESVEISEQVLVFVESILTEFEGWGIPI